jgi:hypothetical protein
MCLLSVSAIHDGEAMVLATVRFTTIKLIVKSLVCLALNSESERFFPDNVFSEETRASEDKLADMERTAVVDL